MVVLEIKVSPRVKFSDGVGGWVVWVGGVDKWQRGKKGGMESKAKLNTGSDLAVLVLRWFSR